MSKKVTDPNAKSNSGFLWGLVVLLVIVAVVIGYIVFSAQGARTAKLAERAEETTMEVTLADNVVTLSAPNAAADAVEVDLFEDFSCSYCADLARNTDEDMKAAIEAGDLVVRIHHLNFLDSNSPADATGHSTQAVTAVSRLAQSGDAKAYWNLRKILLEDQKDVAYKWGEKEFAEAAAAFGASEADVAAIKEADLSLGQTVATAAYEELESSTGSVSSPRVLQNGADIDLQDLNQWVGYVLDNA